MTEQKLRRLLQTAGKNFFILHIEDILESYNSLVEDPDFKTRKIKQYYAKQHGFKSKDERGIRVRLYAVMQIIEADQVRDALMQINADDPRILPEAAAKLNQIIARHRRVSP